MWNGIWKLTAMVGVIGIGLFAAYYAQQAMNRTAAIAPDNQDLDPVENRSGQKDLSRESPFVESASDEVTTNGFANSGARRRRPKSLPKSQADSQIELLGNHSSEPGLIKHAVATEQTAARVSPVKRKQASSGISFVDTVDFTDEETPLDETKPNAREARQLPDDEFTEETPSTPAKTGIQQTGAAEQRSLNDSKTDPFNIDDVPATNPSDSVPPKSNVVPRQPRAPAELDAETDPPFSHRARANAERRGESTNEPAARRPSDKPTLNSPLKLRENSTSKLQEPAELDPFGSEESLPSSPTLGAAHSESAIAPVLGAPETFEDPAAGASLFEKKPLRSSPPSRLNDETAPFADDFPPTRSLPAKTRLEPRAPADLNTNLIEDSSFPSRQPVKRRSELDRALPGDMVGDGEIGNTSSKGMQQPRLTIEKVAAQQAILEQPLIYTIIVKNTGTVDAHNVVIEDRIPKGTELIGSSPRADLVGKRLIWNEPLLKPNEEKKISIKVIPKQEGPIGSVARVYFATEVSTEIVVAAPQLEFTMKAPPREVRLGQNFDLVYLLRNIGKVDATNITIRDFVPENLKHEYGTDIECPIGKLAPQEVREIVLPVTAIKTGVGDNHAILTADSGIKKELNNSINVVGELLVLTRTGNNRIYVSKSAEFTNTIRNDGNLGVNRVRISEVVPAGMEFETASDDGIYDPKERAVIWTLGQLNPGDDRAVTVKYVPRKTGVHAAKITATGAAGSKASINASVDVVGKPELQMETLTATGEVTIGDQIKSRFQLNNTGTAPARNVQLRVRLPRELRLVSVHPAKYQQQGEFITFDPIDEIAPLSKSAFELTLEPVEEADAQISLEVSAEHLKKPHKRLETIQIKRDALK